MADDNNNSEPEIAPPGVSFKGTGGEAMDDGASILSHPLMWPRVTYGLYSIAIISGFPMLVGLIVAYMARPEAPAWLKSHYTYLIVTFWMGLGLIIIGLVTWIFGVGMIVLWLLPLWYLVRIVRGWIWLERRIAVPDPQSLLFGGSF